MSNGLLVTLRPMVRHSVAVDDVEEALDPTDRIILSIMIADPSASIARISSETGLSNRIVRYRLDKLREKDIVTREGSKKTGNWIVKSDENNRFGYLPFYAPIMPPSALQIYGPYKWSPNPCETSR